jgi:putative ABC transport system substrate-binding protein
MRRRDLLAAVAGAATWSRLATAQQRHVPTVGFLYSGSRFGGPQENAIAFLKGLAETGWVEGRNVRFENREAKNNLALLPELARELVRSQVDVIMAPGSGAAALAAKDATTTIPIVFSNAGNPIQSGIVTSLSHPGGNITGIADFGIALSAKRLELIRLLLPAAAEVAYLAVRNQPGIAGEITNAEEGARALGIDMFVLSVNAAAEIDSAFATLAERRVDAVCMVTNAMFFANRERIVALAARHRLPTVYPFIEYTRSGGLMSYGSSLADRSYQAGVYVGSILNGEKPGDLPIRRLTKFELAINMTTARALGLTAPPRLLALTDKVIE